MQFVRSKKLEEAGMKPRQMLRLAVAFLIAVFGSQSFGQGSGPAWTQLSPSGGPPQLFNYQPTIVRDPATNRLIFYGRNSGGTSEVWVLTNSNGLNGAPDWIQLNPAGGPPPSRGNHFGVYDPTSNRMMICRRSAHPTPRRRRRLRSGHESDDHFWWTGRQRLRFSLGYVP